jgi:predicted Zn-ribbon and HTH transcriptional regulator
MKDTTENMQDYAKRINRFYAERRAERGEAERPPAESSPAPIERHVCARCGWTWQTFAGKEPKACPGCRARKWQTPAPPRISDTVRECLHCGHKWRARKAARPCACPVCASPNWDKPPKFRRGTAGQGEKSHNAP